MIASKICKRGLKIVGLALLILLAAAAAGIGFLSVTEYKPEAVEDLPIAGSSEKVLRKGDSLRVVTWNIGYGALGESADFFMDGGSMVNTASGEQVTENLDAILGELKELSPDIALLQEVDVDSARSHYINERDMLAQMEGYESTFANNFKTKFIPYPIPPIGKVDSGIMTLSRYSIGQSERISLPVPFTWPVSMVNLKRCLNVSVLPVEGSEHDLILVNLHLEAFDEGEGKRMQTMQLKELLEQAGDRGDYVIAGGDFNQVFSEVDISVYPVLEGTWQPGEIDTAEFSDMLHFQMDPSTPTGRSLDRVLADAPSREPEDFQYYMIDGFIVSDNISVASLETIDLGFVNSDHNPVVMDIQLS